MNIVESNTKVSVKDYWQTPEHIVTSVGALLNRRISLDPCAKDETNAKYMHFIDEELDGLKTSWFDFIGFNELDCAVDGFVFVNPPFSQLKAWAMKCVEEANKGLVVVLLHPDTPDTTVYQYIEDNCNLQLVPTSRVNFIDPDTGKIKSGVNFPSVLSVFTGMPKKSLDRIRFNLDSKPTHITEVIDITRNSFLD